MGMLLAGLTGRRLTLVLVDHALIVLAVLAAVAIRIGTTDLVETRLVWHLLWRGGVDGRRAADLPALSPTSTTCARSRPARSGHPPAAGARRRVAHAGGRSITGCRRSIIGRGVFVVASVLVIVARRPAGAWPSSGWPCGVGPARAAADRRHEQRRRSTLARELFERRQRARASSSSASSIPTRAGRQTADQPGNHRHDRRHSRHRRAAAASIAWWSASPTRAASCRWTSCSR